MSRPERHSSVQALAWLNAIAENDSGGEIEDEYVGEGLDQMSANLEQIQPIPEVLTSVESEFENA